MNEIREFLALRSSLYVLLGKVFYREADETWLAEINRYVPVLDHLAELYGNPVLKEGLDKFRTFYASAADTEERRLSMARAFAHIFLSTAYAVEGKSVVPHESVYISGLVMRDEMDQVLKVYCDNQAGRTPDFKEPEDHITAEMGFMAYMSKKAARTDDRQEYFLHINTQYDFMKDHLMRFAPQVCDDIVRFEYDFYECMALIVKGFLECDFDFISVLKEETALTQAG